MRSQLDWLVAVMIDGKTVAKIEHFAGKHPDFHKHLRTFGEACVVRVKRQTSPKLNYRGNTTMFAGYCTDKPGDRYISLLLYFPAMYCSFYCIPAAAIRSAAILAPAMFLALGPNSISARPPDTKILVLVLAIVVFLVVVVSALAPR